MPPLARRWLIVLALFFVTFGISMPLAAYGVFLPIIAETFGWSRGAMSIALSINLVLGGIAGFFVGALADRHGPRVMLFVTVGFAGMGFGLVSTIGALWHLYLLVGLLAGVGMSSFYLLSTATVARWFDDRRGLAIALVLVGFNLGYIVAGPLAASLIAAVGWRAAYALLGGGCALLAMIAASTVRVPREAEAEVLHQAARMRRAAVTRARVSPAAGAGAAAAGPGARAAGGAAPGPASVVADARTAGPVVAAPRALAGVTLREALADPRQWCLNLAWLLLGSIILMVGVHAVPYVRDLGVSLGAASFALTAYGLGSIAGRVTSGAVGDRVGTRVTMGIGYAIEIVALMLLASGTSPGVLLFAMVLFGVGAATTDTMLVKAIPDLFGLRALGAIMGVLTLGWRCGAATGPATAGFLYDATGSYAVPFWSAPVAVLVSAVMFTLATRPRR